MCISLTDAINRIYHSQLYKKLSTESTKYWHLGPVDLYNELKKEYDFNYERESSWEYFTKGV